MKIETAFQSKEEMEIRRDLSTTNEWPSQFRFLNVYNGYRRGFAHVFLGNTHAGKSTLVRSLLLDAAMREDARILLYLSEESVNDFKTEMAFVGKEVEFLKRISIYSEQDDEPNQDLLEVMKALVYQVEPNLVFLDNLTTCFQYNNGGPNTQGAISQGLKRMFSGEGIPWVTFLHTAKGANDPRRLVTTDDVRGVQSLVNEAQFCAGVNKIEDPDGVVTSILRILKHRGQTVVDKNYRLNYSTRSRVYTDDNAVNMDRLKEWLNRK